MNRLFVVTTATLTAVIGVLVGVLLSVERPVQPIAPVPLASASVSSESRPASPPSSTKRAWSRSLVPGAAGAHPIMALKSDPLPKV